MRQQWKVRVCWDKKTGVTLYGTAERAELQKMKLLEDSGTVFGSEIFLKQEDSKTLQKADLSSYKNKNEQPPTLKSCFSAFFFILRLNYSSYLTFSIFLPLSFITAFNHGLPKIILKQG